MADDVRFSTLLKRWLIGDVVASESLHHKGTVFLITTGCGARFILKDIVKDIGGHRRIERLMAEHRVHLHLQAAQVPVAVPLLAHDGRPFVQDGDKIYTLAPELASGGYTAGMDMGQVYHNMGMAIGRLHKALATYPDEIPSWRMDLPRRILGEAVPRINAHLAGPRLEAFNRMMTPIGDALAGALADLPSQHIHGDCHGGNILLHDGDVSGFIDLDHLPVGPKPYDLGSLLADRAKWQMAHPDALIQWLEYFDRVIVGYEQENCLSRREKEAIWWTMLAVQVLMTEWFSERHDETNVALNLAAFHWIHSHKEEIVPRILHAYWTCEV
jgi:Ser/Thr protein kinase RdoA (MazF antagonist)